MTYIPQYNQTEEHFSRSLVVESEKSDDYISLFKYYIIYFKEIQLFYIIYSYLLFIVG